MHVCVQPIDKVLTAFYCTVDANCISRVQVPSSNFESLNHAVYANQVKTAHKLNAHEEWLK
jgi:hypothetical protein